MLNQSKGPAVRALRAQIDKDKYSQLIYEAAKHHPHLNLMASMVEDLIVEQGQIQGVVLTGGQKILAPAVLITTGTYLTLKFCKVWKNCQRPRRWKRQLWLECCLSATWFFTPET